MKSYIFVAGVHGSGKSTLLTKISNQLKVVQYSISDLIRLAGKTIETSEKNTSDIKNNQDLWRQELEKLDFESDNQLMLDGHFSLLGEDGNIVVISNEVFSYTAMEKIILIDTSPEVIKERLLKRDNRNYDLEILREFCKKEKLQALAYSEEHDIPLMIYKNDLDYEELIIFIEK